MEKMSSEVRASLDAILNYDFAAEQKHYEEEHDVEITDDDYNNPDRLEDKDHVFYHILVVQQYLNQ
jgi:hypothetical protein